MKQEKNQVFLMDADETVRIIIDDVAYHVMGYEIMALIEMQGEEIAQYLSVKDETSYYKAIGGLE